MSDLNGEALIRLFLPASRFILRARPHDELPDVLFTRIQPPSTGTDIAPILIDRGAWSLLPLRHREHSSNPKLRQSFVDRAAQIIARNEVRLPPQDTVALIDTMIARIADDPSDEIRSRLAVAVYRLLRPLGKTTLTRRSFPITVYENLARAMDRTKADTVNETIVTAMAFILVGSSAEFAERPSPEQVCYGEPHPLVTLHHIMSNHLAIAARRISAGERRNVKLPFFRCGLNYLTRAAEHNPDLLTPNYGATLLECCDLYTGEAIRIGSAETRRRGLSLAEAMAHNDKADETRKHLRLVREDSARGLLSALRMLELGQAPLPAHRFIATRRLEDLVSRSVDSNLSSAVCQDMLHEAVRTHRRLRMPNRRPVWPPSVPLSLAPATRAERRVP